MQLKKYRVICWQPSDAMPEDEVFVDIAPENGVIHNMMLYSCLKLYRGTNPHKNIKNVGGSIYLSAVEDENPTITFAQASQSLQQRLLPLIVDRYQKMRAEGKDSTLSSIISAWEAEKFADEFMSPKARQDADAFMQRERRKRSMYMQKHQPQTPQDERMLKEEQEFNLSVSRRQAAIQTRAAQDSRQNPIERMKNRMRQYDGD